MASQTRRRGLPRQAQGGAAASEDSDRVGGTSQQGTRLRAEILGRTRLGTHGDGSWDRTADKVLQLPRAAQARRGSSSNRKANNLAQINDPEVETGDRPTLPRTSSRHSSPTSAL